MEQSANNIIIDVKSNYLSEESVPEDNRYVFAYTITIHNKGGTAARLTHRHWLITDADGETEEVHGEGVIGKQPHIEPGQSFQYTSGTVIKTPVGAMQGHYDMVADNGDNFQADIRPFTLHVPGSLH